MKTPAQLVLTHGTTDLQVLVRDTNGRLWRAVPDKLIVRRFHEWLLEQAEQIDVVDLPPEVQRSDAEAPFTDWNEKTLTFALWLRDGRPDAHPELSEAGHMQVVLPKITPTLRQWLEQQAQPYPVTAAGRSSMADALQKIGIQTAPLGSVLVLSTDRGHDEQEPVATFTFLKRWLVRPGLGEESIREFVFLHAGERLESGDQPVAPAIAQRIENALFDFYDRTNKPTLLVATMGGLPNVKPLLAENAFLLAGTQARNLFKTEHGTSGLVPDHAPLEALRVRRLCLQAVRRGALLDAYAMASPFHDAPDARPWVRPLEQAARLLNGNPMHDHVTLPSLRAILQHAKQAQCLLVAIRVETALLNERWLEAINGSLTFLDAAFHDAINAWADNTLLAYDSRQRYMHFRVPPPNVLRDSQALKPWKYGSSLEFQAHVVGVEALTAWGQVLNIQSINRLRKTIHNKSKLPNGRKDSLADFRNYNTHGVMTQAEIDDAVTRFMGADLWSQGVNNPSARPKSGKCFIARSLVSETIADLGGSEVNALSLYQALLQQLEETLLSPGTHWS